MGPDITEFLLARWAEEEQTARAVPGSGIWSAYLEGGDDGWAIESEGGDPAAIIGNQAMAEHIAQHAPASVLAEIKAKRRIVARHKNYDYPHDPEDGPGEYVWTPRCDYCQQEWPCPDLRDLGAPLADQADYREEWKP